MPALIYRRADGTEKRMELGAKPLIIGRLPESEIQVKDPFISRVHAGIGYANNAFTLKDLGSTNGTYRNGARVFECNLASGDKIQVGNATLIFEIDGTGDAILRQVPHLTTAPRPTAAAPAPPLRPPPPPPARPSAAASPERQLTIPVKGPVPPAER
jgi:predicted component of type VI protein secretion system